MAVYRLEIAGRNAYENGRVFGEVGAYERIDAVAHYAVDPDAPGNSLIVDLALAPRNDEGLVEFEGDVTILRPVDPDRGRRAALVEVPNRGRRTAVSTFNRAPALTEPTVEIDPGDGFLFRHGWTLAWCGWQWDVPRSPARMGLSAPVVVDATGAPKEGEVQLRLQLHDRVRSVDLTDHHVGLLGGHQPLPTVDVDDASARLLRRDGIWGEPEELPRDTWRFARDEAGRPVPAADHVWLDDGFEPGRIYDLIYQSAPCPVVGAGLLAVRDLGTFLRSTEVDNPCRGELDHLIATGQSQCGRLLRTFLHLGLNRSETGGLAYDGVHAHIAGGRRGEFNHRLAQPSVQPTPSFGHRFPFADDPQTDPGSGSTAGLLDTQRAVQAVPRIFYTNTSSEYWRGDASLAHTSATDGADVDPPETTRHYLFASTQHGPGALPLMSRSLFGSHGGNDFNIVDYTPLMRAAVTNLLAWIVDGVEPSPNSVPRCDDGTGATREAVLQSMNGMATMARPAATGLWTIRPLDLGPRAAEGVGRYPAAPVGGAYPCLVSAVDEDGNEIAGIRLPEVAVPVATHTGWNPRHPDSGASDEILDYLGSTVPFPLDARAREQADDRRLSIAERYVDEADYRRRIRVAALELVGARVLLDEDVDTCEAIALERYRAVTGDPAP